MPSVSNFDLIIHYAMEELCESFRTIAYRVVKLQLVNVNVCGSLVLSNSVTNIGDQLYQGHIESYGQGNV